ncbi:hypothetical protein [Sphingobacterium sp. 40-24]|uniref:hypothetical protein n=1 Tax=Sphingobacterium sp. 40-24 TaxID=1895843 RepID=UPI000960AB56|nr:hypothetical protein [Sphingobacterium sp. 40-24]OJZ03213.1 MAG: hypothetical protein BGP15_19210 [Sphingobacterium sp. 40-24]
MKSKFILLGLACLSFGTTVKAQDLIKQIPEDAEMIAAFHMKDIVQKANANKLNELLQKTGFFEKSGISANNDIKNLGVDLSQTAYFYTRKTDSISFTEFIFSLNNKGQFEKLLHEAGEPKTFANGYTSIGLKAGSMLVYNDRIARFVSATTNTTFLDNDSIASRYGIKKVDYVARPADDEDAWADTTVAAMDSAAVVWDADESLAPPVAVAVEPDTVVLGATEVLPPVVDIAAAADAAADAAEMHDPSYYDSLYTAYEDQNRKNDSIRNGLRDKWLLNEVTRLVSGSHKSLSIADQQKVLKNLGLIRLYVPHVEDLYRGLMPYTTSLPYYYMGIKLDKFKTGYQDGVLDLVQEGNVLKLKGSVGLDKDLAEMTKRMYARKPNSKFSKYLTDKTLGFFNVNINSEAYLREMPAYMAKYYSGLLGPQQDVLEWGLMALEIALDEKAIAEVMPGDHLVVVNGLRKFKKDYIDYTYDDDYNATEVKKTKEETLPVFIWMFTSKDQRLIKKGLEMAVSKQVGQVHDGIYAFSKQKAKDFPMYVLLKEDLVMVSNDSLSLNDIRQNKMNAPVNKDFAKLMKQNKMSAAIDLQKLPAMLKEMGVTPGRQWEATVAQLNQYGSTAVTSKGVVGNRAEVEMSTRLPQTSDGAISYLLDQIMAELNKK